MVRSIAFSFLISYISAEVVNQFTLFPKVSQRSKAFHYTSAITNSSIVLSTTKVPTITSINDSNTTNDFNDKKDTAVTNASNQFYNLSEGPLECAQIWPYLHLRGEAACRQEWPQGTSLPQVICELVGGHHPVAGTFATLMHGIAIYQLTNTLVGNATNAMAGAEANTLTGWCAYQSRFEMRRVQSFPEGVPVVEDTFLNETTADGEKQGKDQIMVLISQGVRHIFYDYGPAGIGASAAIFTRDDCPTCPAEIWNVEFERTANLVDIYLNRATRVLLEFLPAFMPLATEMMGLLNKEALVEEIEIRGGERWDDVLIFKSDLQFLRRLDFSGNGIRALSKENFLHTRNLHHLDLSNNLFMEIPMGICQLKQLQTLDLSWNPFVATPFEPLLRSLPQLSVLNISGLPLTSLDVLTSNDMEEDRFPEDDKEANMLLQLTEIHVNDCNVTSLDTPGTRRLFQRLINLRTLSLSGNPLETVPHDLAESLPALQELDLSRCLLRAPPALRLLPAQHLRLLNLSRNLLGTPSAALAPLAAGGGVALLDVSGNELRCEWGAHAFAPLGVNASLNLSRTELPWLTRSMLEPLQGLRAVDLGGNPFDCSKCAIRDLQEWLQNSTEAGPEVLSLGERKPLECALPPAERGRAVRDAAGPPATECSEAAADTSTWNAATATGTGVALMLLATGALALFAFRFRLELTYVLHAFRANRSISSSLAHRSSNRYEFDAFVCYSKHDRAWVLGELLPRLEGDNPRYRLCLHERDFPLGSLIVRNIVECMERSRRTIIVLTKAFVESQWCQWELEMATHHLLEGAGRDFLVLVELEPLESRALPRLLRLLVETRTFLQWPSALAAGCAPGAGTGSCVNGLDSATAEAWRRLRLALGPPLCHTVTSQPSTPPILTPPDGQSSPTSGENILLNNVDVRV